MRIRATFASATYTLLTLSSVSAFAANFVQLGTYGNEIDATSIERRGDEVHYIIRRPNEPTTGLRAVVNCVTRQRAERGPRSAKPANNGEFIDVLPDTPNALELDVACGNVPMPSITAHNQFDFDRLNALESKLAEEIAIESARPKKSFITRSTREVGHAMYYDSVRRKIEEFGTRNFPSADGKRLYGLVFISIPIYQDGSIYEKDGGPVVEKSSGDERLDKAAVAIARNAGPFGSFPKNLRSPDREDVWVLTAPFNFTKVNDEQSEAPPNAIGNAK